MQLETSKANNLNIDHGEADQHHLELEAVEVKDDDKVRVAASDWRKRYIAAKNGPRAVTLDLKIDMASEQQPRNEKPPRPTTSSTTTTTTTTTTTRRTTTIKPPAATQKVSTHRDPGRSGVGKPPKLGKSVQRSYFGRGLSLLENSCKRRSSQALKFKCHRM